MRTRGIVLCSGSSSRMGRPKALLRCAEETFLERILRTFREGGVEELAVVIGGPDVDALRAAVPTGVAVIENPDPTPGPISSVICGLRDASRDAFLIHPVDIPGLEAVDVAAILAAGADHPGADAVIPSISRRRAHPVLLRRALAARILASGAETTLRDHLSAEGVQVHHVERTNSWLRFDVDTPQDLEHFRAQRS